MGRSFTGGEVFAGQQGLKTGQDLEDLVELAEPTVEATDNYGGAGTLDVASAGGQVRLKVKDGGIGTTQLADDAVTADKIADGVITNAKMDAAFTMVNSIQRGTKTVAAGATDTVTITAVVTAKSYVIVNVASEDVSTNQSASCNVTLTNTTTLTFVNRNTSYDAIVDWQVVELI